MLVVKFGVVAMQCLLCYDCCGSVLGCVCRVVLLFFCCVSFALSCVVCCVCLVCVVCCIALFKFVVIAIFVLWVHLVLCVVLFVWCVLCC